MKNIEKHFVDFARLSDPENDKEKIEIPSEILTFISIIDDAINFDLVSICAQIYSEAEIGMTRKVKNSLSGIPTTDLVAAKQVGPPITNKQRKQ